MFSNPCDNPIRRPECENQELEVPADPGQLHQFLQPVCRPHDHVEGHQQRDANRRDERPYRRWLVSSWLRGHRIARVDLQFFLMACLNGAPALRTTPERMYSKHDVRKSAVFSEFLILDLSGLMTGGINLHLPLAVWYQSICPENHGRGGGVNTKVADERL